MAIYVKNSYTAGAYGKVQTPIKMIIEHESDLIKKKGGICDWLFNVEKSNRFAETIIIEKEFNMFSRVSEGQAAPSESIIETYTRFFEHIQFMKEFSISAEMMEDAVNGIATDAKRRARNFIHAYYKTINKICEAVLANGHNVSTNIANATISTTTADSRPLFCNEHLWGDMHDNNIQSNYFYGDIFRSGTDRVASCAVFDEVLSELSSRLRNLLDENGEPLGYTADTLILPGNRPTAEMIAKKVCGSYGTPGTSNNDINIHYGNWNIIILPHWQTTEDRVIVMSSEANKALCGNLFFNRVPLTISNWIDHHTGNYMWTGRCRFGVGFGSYKHALLAVDSVDAVDNADKL